MSQFRMISCLVGHNRLIQTGQMWFGIVRDVLIKVYVMSEIKKKKQNIKEYSLYGKIKLELDLTFCRLIISTYNIFKCTVKRLSW